MKTMQSQQQQQQNYHYQQHQHAQPPPVQSYQQGYAQDAHYQDQHDPQEYQEEQAEEQQSTHLSQVNQSILQRLKQQQAQRIMERRQYELTQLEQQMQQFGTSKHQQPTAAFTQPSSPGIDLVPASGQFRPSSSGSAKKHDSVHSQQQRQQKQHQQNRNDDAIHDQQTHGQQKQQPQHESNFSNQGNEGNDQEEEEDVFNVPGQQQQEQQEQPQNQEHLLAMTIDLGDGKQGQLHIYEQDDSLSVAEDFCSKNNLTHEAMVILAKNIEANKQIVLAERKQTLRSNSRLNGNNNNINQNYHSQPSKDDLNEGNPGDVRNNYYKVAGQLAHARSAQNLNSRLPNEHYPQHQPAGAAQVRSYAELDEGEERRSATNQRNNDDDYQVISPQGDKQSIFDRLYKDAASKEQRLRKRQQQDNNNNRNSNHHGSSHSKLGASQSTRTIKKQIGSVELNLGEYLYHKGQQMQSNRQQNAEEYILLQIEKEKLLPFHPEINYNSQRICQAKRNEYGESTEDHLLKQGLIYKEKKDMLKSHFDQEVVQNCTFKPTVNPVSEYLIDLRKAQQEFDEGDNFEKLHQEAKRRVQLKNERGQAPECTFHPKITRPPKNFDENQNFVDRMMLSVNTKEKKRQELKLKQKFEEEYKNEYTFTPAVGRGPVERNVQGLPVHEYLFNKKKEQTLKQANLLHFEQQKEHAASRVSAIDASTQIVEKNKFQRFHELFAALDNDLDGLISDSCVDTTQISVEIKQFIYPILKELELNQTHAINFEQFYLFLIKLMNGLTIVQREALFNFSKNKWEKNRPKQLKFEFKPTINRRSQALIRSPNKFKRLYDKGLESKKMKASKVETIKEELIQKELSGCTFKPNLHRPMKIYAFTDPKISKRDSNFFNGHHAFETAGGDGQFRVTGIVHNTPTINSIQQ